MTTKTSNRTKEFNKLRAFITFIILYPCIYISAFAQSPNNNEVSFGVGDSVYFYPNVKWIKGDPIREFEKGKVYIIECWATWCGPCLDAIPHLNNLQKEMGDKVVVIGQNVFEKDVLKAEKFVDKQGDAMSYSIAVEEEGLNFKKEWLVPAKVSAIPFTFVIYNNKLIWTTHPNSLTPESINMIIDNTFTPEKAEFVAPTNQFRRFRDLIKSKDFKQAEVLTDSLLNANPDEEIYIAARISFLKEANRKDELINYVTDNYLKADKSLFWKIKYYDMLEFIKDYDLLISSLEKNGDLNTKSGKEIQLRSLLYKEQYQEAREYLNDLIANTSNLKDISNVLFLDVNDEEFNDILIGLAKVFIDQKHNSMVIRLRLIDLLWKNNQKEEALDIVNTSKENDFEGEIEKAKYSQKYDEFIKDLSEGKKMTLYDYYKFYM